MSHGATFLKGNYELPRGPVKLSRERWEMLAQQFRLPPRFGAITEAITLDVPREIDGVIFLPAEYVPLDAHG